MRIKTNNFFFALTKDGGINFEICKLRISGNACPDHNRSILPYGWFVVEWDYENILQVLRRHIIFAVDRRGRVAFQFFKLGIDSCASINHKALYYQYGYFSVSWGENVLFEFGKE